MFHGLHVFIGFSCVLLGLTGCSQSGLLTRMGVDDPQPTWRDYRAEDGYVLLDTSESRLVIDPQKNGAILFSLQSQDADMVPLEDISTSRGRSQPYEADRLRLGTSGELDIQPNAIRVLSQTSYRCSMERIFQLIDASGGAFSAIMERKVRVLGSNDIARVFPRIRSSRATMVAISGYESRNMFFNPGPLPWPASGALPHILVEGSFRRSGETVLILPTQSGKADLEHRFPGFRSATNEYAMACVLTKTASSRVVVPVDFVRPLIVLLDRPSGLLTLIRYTPPVSLSVGRNKGVLRPDLVLHFSEVKSARRWVKVMTGGTALSLAKGGSTRHHRSTYHARGDEEMLQNLAADFLGMPAEEFAALLEQLDRGPE